MHPNVKKLMLLGGSGVLTPDRLPGLAAWYSADFGVLTSVGPDVAATDGQTVRRWLDRSGNGRHLDQATLANQPTFSGGSVMFGGVNKLMLATIPYSAIGCELVDFTTTEEVANAGPFDRSGSGLHYLRNSGGTYVFGIYNASAKIASSGIPVAALTRNIVACNYGPPGMSVSANGGMFATNSYEGRSQAPTDAMLLGFTQGYYKGAIHSFMHFDNQLSLAQIIKINKFLRKS